MIIALTISPFLNNVETSNEALISLKIVIVFVGEPSIVGLFGSAFKNLTLKLFWLAESLPDSFIDKSIFILTEEVY